MKVAASNPADDDNVCEHCGNPEALEIAGKWLCLNCIAEAGCGCGGAADEENE
jgi:hypothetical protein